MPHTWQDAVGKGIQLHRSCCWRCPSFDFGHQWKALGILGKRAETVTVHCFCYTIFSCRRFPIFDKELFGVAVLQDKLERSFRLLWRCIQLHLSKCWSERKIKLNISEVWNAIDWTPGLIPSCKFLESPERAFSTRALEEETKWGDNMFTLKFSPQNVAAKVQSLMRVKGNRNKLKKLRSPWLDSRTNHQLRFKQV